MGARKERAATSLAAIHAEVSTQPVEVADAANRATPQQRRRNPHQQ